MRTRQGHKAVLYAASLVFMYFGLPSGAFAGDLGGTCCTDLEERVAELEATTVKKGNRKVSVTLSGYVTQQVMYWDDGSQKDMYVGDGGPMSSRFRFTGEAKINADVTAGFTYEFGIDNNRIGNMNQGNGGDDLDGTTAAGTSGRTDVLRDSTVWLRHKNLGMVKVGHGSTATDNLILIDLSGAGVAMTPDVALWNGGFGMRIDTLSLGGVPIPAAHGINTGIGWAALFNGGTSFDTARRNHVLYETPTLMGFTVSAAVGEDNFWDVALRYAGEFSGFRLAAGVGYSVDTELPVFSPGSTTSMKETKGSASLMHMASGLFVTAAGGMRETELGLTVPAPFSFSIKDGHFWHVAAGISKNWTGLGATVLFAEYQQARDMFGFSAGGPGGSVSLGTDATMWGVGVVQHIDAAAMEVFLTYKNFSGGADLTSSLPNIHGSLDMQDFQAVIGGARVSF